MFAFSAVATFEHLQFEHLECCVSECCVSECCVSERCAAGVAGGASPSGAHFGGCGVVVGTEYALSVVLTQGDSNDDNRIDILDFGQFVASRGATFATNAISNFNADTIVNNSDLSFISVNFFYIGDTCGSYTGDPALERIKVKDLRRAGMGHLDIADLNHDGCAHGHLATPMLQSSV